LALEKLKATTVPSDQEQKLEDDLKKKLADEEAERQRKIREAKE
jgi:hypothetical protein